MKLLILLVGSNPLPLYATAKFLLDADENINEDLAKPDKIMLIYTEDTQKFADNLCAVLSLDDQKKVMVDLESDGRKPNKIREKITNKLKTLIPSESTENHVVHLNYIGGTKTMAVQSVLAVTEWANGKANIHCILSDVDPALDKIIFSDTGFGIPVGNELKRFVELTLEDLLRLHGMGINSRGNENLRLSEDNLLRLSRIKLGARQKSNQESEIDNDNEIFLSEIKNRVGQKFLDGGWLEDLVLRSLIKLRSERVINFQEPRANVYAQYNNRQTELDAIVIKGYQLFLFSCATAKKIGSIKQKAFEALYRADQLGGEHAKVVIVCTLYNYGSNDEPNNSYRNMNNLEELQKDLEQFIARRNCRLIGLNELVGEIEGRNTLTNTIKHILEGGI